MPAKKNGVERASRNRRGMWSGWNKWVARAKGKQNSTHDFHVVTAASGRRKKIGLYLLHFGRLPLPSFLLFHSGACIDSEPSKFNERVNVRRKLRDTIKLGKGDARSFNELLVISEFLPSVDEQCHPSETDVKRAVIVE